MFPCIVVKRRKSGQTKNLMGFSKTIIEANEAAAPISNATARDIANHLGLDIPKKVMT